MKNTINAFFAIFPWLHRSRNSGEGLIGEFHADHVVRVGEHKVGAIVVLLALHEELVPEVPRTDKRESTAYQCQNTPVLSFVCRKERSYLDMRD